MSNAIEGIVDYIKPENYSMRIDKIWYKFSTKTEGLKLLDLQTGVKVRLEYNQAKKDGHITNWINKGEVEI